MAHESHETWHSSTETFHEDLEEICLNDDAEFAPVPLPPGSRPEVLGGIVHECLFVVVIALAAASSVFLQRSMFVIVADISLDLRLNRPETAWINGASALTTGAFLIPFGYLADVCPVLSRKYLLILSLTAFSLIVAFTSFFNSGTMIDIMSGLAGLTCAATIPIAVGLLSTVYPEPSRRRNLVFSSLLMGNPAATIIGGLGTGGVASAFTWKAAFIFLGILYALITIFSWWIVPNVSKSRSDPKHQEIQHFNTANSFFLASKKAPVIGTALRSFDWTGLFLLFAGILLFTVALTIGPDGSQPWKTPKVVVLLILGLLLLGSFIIWESWTATPMIPPVV
ncbi:putative Major facilitator superfamily (MFS) profile domain-containing protein [Seiridium cardinale]